MRTLILAAIGAAVVGSAACTANPPDAPAVTIAAPDPGSCEARNDRTPCTLTNQEALIEILQLSQTNVLCQYWKQPVTWQEMLLVPVRATNSDSRCYPAKQIGTPK